MSETVKAQGEKRSCAYCGQDRVCRCKYRFMRMGSTGIQMHNTSRQSTVAELREEFEDLTKNMKPDANVAWMFSVTKLDAAKMTKADSKRAALPVPDKESL